GANIVASTFTSFGSVVALPQGGGNSCEVTSSATSNGYNFEDATSCGFGGGTGDITNGGDPLLNALANNGGPTDTRAPQASSALLDKIPNGSCQSGAATNIVSDQRDFVRPYSNGSMCD